MVVYLILMRPFETVKDNLIEIFNDFIYVVQTVLVMVISEEDFRSTQLSNLMIYLVIISGFVTLIILVLSALFSVLVLLRR